MIEDAVNWSARHGMEPFQRLIGIDGYPSGVTKQEEKKTRNLAATSRPAPAFA